MRSRRQIVAVATAALLLALSGCSDTADDPASPASSATPTVVSPSPVASPTPDMDALYAEAEAVLRAATEWEETAIREGPPDYPVELESLLADPYLSLSKAGVSEYWELGWTIPPDESFTLIVRPVPGMTRNGSEVALEGCYQTANAMDESGTVVSASRLLHKYYYFKHVDGQLRLFGATREGQIEQCHFD